MSASLATLASDCIAELLHYLNGDDLITLMMSGNRLLRQKLRLKCNSLSFVDVPPTLFPFEALKLPNLRSLSVHGIFEVATYLDYSTRDESALYRGHKTLDKLELGFRNAFDFLFPSNVMVLRLTIQDRFPTLSTLIMHDIFCEEPIDSLIFGELPATLRILSLAHYKDRKVAKMDLSSISKLPNHLTSLTLTGFSLYRARKDVICSKTIFPPNLLHLDLQALYDATILDHWPATLKTLRFTTELSPSGFSWKASKIPSGLQELYVQNDGWTLELDVPLPETLETFQFTNLLEVENDFTLADMPKGVKKVSDIILRTMARQKPMKSIFERLVNLEYASISSQSDVSCLPERLKELICRIPLHLNTPLPRTLKNLSICSPLTSHCIKHLPSTIQSLAMSTVWAEENNRNFPLCTEVELSQLTSQVRLVYLTIEMNLVRSASCLASLSKMESLKNFGIVKASLHQMITTPEWLPQCLPRYLEALEISFWGTERTLLAKDGKPFHSDDFFSLCDLETVTPHLKTLNLESNHAYGIKFCHFFASLPRGLLKLVLNFRFAKLAPDACSMLPRSLRHLRLVLKMAKSLVSGNMWRGLPSISEFDLILIPTGKFNVELLENLPKSIVAFRYVDSDLQYVPPGSLFRNREFEAAKNQFLLSNQQILGRKARESDKSMF